MNSAIQNQINCIPIRIPIKQKPTVWCCYNYVNFDRKRVDVGGTVKNTHTAAAALVSLSTWNRTEPHCSQTSSVFFLLIFRNEMCAFWCDRSACARNMVPKGSRRQCSQCTRTHGPNLIFEESVCLCVCERANVLFNQQRNVPNRDKATTTTPMWMIMPYILNLRKIT